MKRILSIFALIAVFFVLFSCVSTSQDGSSKGSRPQWVTDEGRQAMFPKAKFVSVLAWGLSADEAKSKAATELSNYVKSSVNAQLDSSFSTTQMDSSAMTEYQKVRKSQSDTTITSQNTLYQIQYTVPWLDKTQNEYFCCAYINRAEAWSFIEPGMQKVRDNFTKQYNDALAQSDSFSKMAGIKRAQSLLPQFYENYDFATFIDANKAASYKGLDNLVAESYEKLALLRQETKIKINVKNDHAKRAYTKLAHLFEDAGFMVTTASSDYVAEAEVSYELDLIGDVYTAYPEFNLNLTHKGTTVNSYNKRIPKVGTYEEKSAVLRIFANLEKELDKSFIDECLSK